MVKISARVHIEPDVGKRVHVEPVVFHLLQAVQKRTECAGKGQVKIVVRVLFEPDVEKRVFIEPPVGKCE
ncbi:hypothetical protein HMPREF9069_01449 [Atopobium sp. oral taxon 810 str. F0209]|nr:hypothetical protein HMPREF9069_01449 [Atopobium sp. oral taxon 810 str. F0209]